MVYVFLATGFEEIEALSVVDVLRRGKQDVQMVGVSAMEVTGSHGISVKCDISLSQIDSTQMEMLVLPGGLPGATNLEESEVVQSFLSYAIEHNIWIGAICAAPAILGRRGILDGKKVTCFPSVKEHLGKGIYTGQPVEQDGRIVTGNGAGSALAFSLQLLSCLAGEELAKEIGKTMQWGAPF